MDSSAAKDPVRTVVDAFPASYLPVENRGFAAACNAGVRHTLSPFVALVNPDVLIHDDVIAELVAVLQREPSAAGVGPRLLRADGTVQPYAFGWEPTPRYLLRRGLRRLLGRPDATTAIAGKCAPFEVDWVAGTCLVFRRRAWQSAGPLDEGYFLYWEDVDWCLRLKRLGWRVLFAPQVAVTHSGGASAGAAAPGYYGRSMVRFYRKWYGPGKALALALLLRLYAPVAAGIRRFRAHRH